MRILVVEDEIVLGDSVVAILKPAFGDTVDLARTGKQAVDRVVGHHYDLVILDWWIPPPTGIELLKTWRAADAVGRVLMLTGSHDGPEREEALIAGADEFLEKPFSLLDLRDRARALLGLDG